MVEQLKLAIISDIHGNIDALRAVLNDADKESVTHYVFLGDYSGLLLYPNEVINLIRQLKNTFVIHGNGETNLKKLVNQDVEMWKSEQLAPLYYAFRSITQDNKNYIFSLPENLTTVLNGKLIHLAHAPTDIFGKTKADELGGKHFAKQSAERLFSHSEYLQYAKTLLNSDESLMTSLANLQDGIYLFGHFHTQWHLEIQNKLLVNPGSCGIPFDGDACSPYTILENINNNWFVHERRIPYDIEKVISELRSSSFYKESNIWGKLIEKGMISAINQILFYLEFVERIAINIGDNERPFSNSVWRLAASQWDWNKE